MRQQLAINLRYCYSAIRATQNMSESRCLPTIVILQLALHFQLLSINGLAWDTKPLLVVCRRLVPWPAFVANKSNTAWLRFASGLYEQTLIECIIVLSCTRRPIQAYPRTRAVLTYTRVTATTFDPPQHLKNTAWVFQHISIGNVIFCSGLWV